MSIFLEGKCLKSELFNRMVEILESAGWSNVSSNATTDFAVMTSKGEDGDKDLVFQLRTGNISNANHIDTTIYPTMSYRFPNSYTPSEEENVAGTFERAGAEAWKSINITAGNVDPAVELNYWYSVNRNRLIMIIYTPESLNMLPCMFYIGLPTHYTSEPQSRGLVCMTSYGAQWANQMIVSDNVAELPTSTASVLCTSYYSLPPKSPNSAGLHTPFEILYGTPAVGVRGKIDSIYFLPNNSVNDGDVLRLGANRYRASQLALSGSNQFPTNIVIYQIS